MMMLRIFDPRYLRALLAFWAACLGFSRLMGQPAADSFSYPAEEVAQWHLHGAGEVTAAGDEVVLREGSDSWGVVLLSPDSFGERVVLSFRVKPNQHEGVLLAMLAVAARDGSPLAVPTDHRGAMPFWNGPAAASANFMAAFHTGYHQPEAFMRRNPGGVDLARTLDPATTARWFEVEFGRDGARVWFRLDGVLLLDSTDPANLSVGAGQVGFRLRGPGDGTFSAQIRDVRVTGSLSDEQTEGAEESVTADLPARVHPLVVTSAP